MKRREFVGRALGLAAAPLALLGGRKAEATPIESPTPFGLLKGWKPFAEPSIDRVAIDLSEHLFFATDHLAIRVTAKYSGSQCVFGGVFAVPRAWFEPQHLGRLDATLRGLLANPTHARWVLVATPFPVTTLPEPDGDDAWARKIRVRFDGAPVFNPRVLAKLKGNP